MVLNAIGGLCNRLRAILSRWHPGIQVIWTRTWDIHNEHFLEVFEPLRGVEFIDHPGHFDEESFNAIENPEPWHERYAWLIPKRLDEIRELQSRLGPYSAMHIRRTDHVALAQMLGDYTHDSQFIEWGRKYDGPMYLATDNQETRSIMQAEFGDRLVMHGEVRPSHATLHQSDRYTTLGDAVFDLFMCAGATNFMGSANSTFSEAAAILNKLRDRAF